MDTYSLTFAETASDENIDFIRGRVTIRQALWLSRTIIAVPNDQTCLDELFSQTWLKVVKVASGDSYRNQWGVVRDH